MYIAFHYLLYFGILSSAIYALIFSIRSRRIQDYITKGLMTSKMNIAMGIMLTLLAVIQLFLFDEVGSGSTIRVIVGALFLLVGLFNIFAGLRNRKMFLQQANKLSKR